MSSNTLLRVKSASKIMLWEKLPTALVYKIMEYVDSSTYSAAAESGRYLHFIMSRSHPKRAQSIQFGIARAQSSHLWEGWKRRRARVGKLIYAANLLSYHLLAVAALISLVLVTWMGNVQNWNKNLNLFCVPLMSWIFYFIGVTTCTLCLTRRVGPTRAEFMKFSFTRSGSTHPNEYAAQEIGVLQTTSGLYALIVFVGPYRSLIPLNLWYALHPYKNAYNRCKAVASLTAMATCLFGIVGLGLHGIVTKQYAVTRIGCPWVVWMLGAATWVSLLLWLQIMNENAEWQWDEKYKVSASRGIVVGAVFLLSLTILPNTAMAIGILALSVFAYLGTLSVIGMLIAYYNWRHPYQEIGCCRRPVECTPVCSSNCGAVWFLLLLLSFVFLFLACSCLWGFDVTSWSLQEFSGLPQWFLEGALIIPTAMLAIVVSYCVIFFVQYLQPAIHKLFAD